MHPPIHGLAWLGVRTERFAEMVAFYRDGLGLPVELETPHQVVFALPGGGHVEVFGPGDPDHPHFDTGPVAGFLVDDVAAARAHAQRAGAEPLGPVHEPGEPGEAWAHFRAPDGNVYEFTSLPMRLRG